MNEKDCKQELLDELDYKEGDKIYIVRLRLEKEDESSSSCKQQTITKYFNPHELVGLLEFQKKQIIKKMEKNLSD